MVYDPNEARDLELTVTLLELAALEIALELAPTSDVTFSRQELFDRARDLGGTQVVLPELDLLIGLRGATFLTRHPGGRYSLK